MASSLAVCIVCRQEASEDSWVFPNAWERTVKTRVCCSSECLHVLDDDVHWIPSWRPAHLDSAEEARQVVQAKRRLANGDPSYVVVRELLCAGVRTDTLGHVLRMQRVQQKIDRERAELAAGVGAVSAGLTGGLLSGVLGLLRRGSAVRRHEELQGTAMREAHVDVMEWCRAWNLPTPGFVEPPENEEPVRRRTGPVTDEELEAATDEELDRIEAGEPAEIVLRSGK